MPINDVHAHLQNPLVTESLDDIITNSIEADIHSIICNGTNTHDWSDVLKIAADYSIVKAALGIHPWHLTLDYQNQLIQLEKSRDKICAIGETGLDGLKGPDLLLQIKSLELHFEIADSFNIPVIMHCVKAFNPLLQLLNRVSPNVPIIIHNFRGSQEMAAALMKHNIFLSLHPGIVNTRSAKLQKMLSYVVTTNFLFESDAPFPFYSQTSYSKPTDIIDAINYLASITSYTAEQIMARTASSYNIVFTT